MFSSYDSDGIRRLSESYVEHLADGSPPTTDPAYLRDLCYTLGCKRSKLAWRTSVVANSRATLRLALIEHPQSLRITPDPCVAFVFTGQGAQWPGMGQELMAYKAFRDSLFSADHFLSGEGCAWSLTGKSLNPRRIKLRASLKRRACR